MVSKQIIFVSTDENCPFEAYHIQYLLLFSEFQIITIHKHIITVYRVGAFIVQWIIAWYYIHQCSDYGRIYISKFSPSKDTWFRFLQYILVLPYNSPVISTHHHFAKTVDSLTHYSDMIKSTTAFQITTISIVYSTACSGTDQRKHQSSTSLAFVRGIHRWPVNNRHKGPVTRKMFPFDDVIMIAIYYDITTHIAWLWQA